jgi:hypothetical protein
VELPPLSVQVFNDVILDDSRNQFLKDCKEKASKRNVDEKFVPFELKEKFDTLSDMWRINEVEIRILNQEPLKN